MTFDKARIIVLASRPEGAPTADNFRLEERELPALGDGELLVRNVVMSVDPYMRGRMNDVKSSPSRTARVRTRLRSEPAPGSVIATAPTISPVHIFGSHRFFCSSVP